MRIKQLSAPSGFAHDSRGVYASFSPFFIFGSKKHLPNVQIRRAYHAMHIEKLPRFALAQLPTPIEKLARLSRELGGPELHIKRDDLTGLALGGNKTRKLE